MFRCAVIILHYFCLRPFRAEQNNASLNGAPPHSDCYWPFRPRSTMFSVSSTLLFSLKGQEQLGYGITMANDKSKPSALKGRKPKPLATPENTQTLTLALKGHENKPLAAPKDTQILTLALKGHEHKPLATPKEVIRGGRLP